MVTRGLPNIQMLYYCFYIPSGPDDCDVKRHPFACAKCLLPERSCAASSEGVPCWPGPGRSVA
eukprot:9314047-Alexandrium_andersonii.AAC.1